MDVLRIATAGSVDDGKSTLIGRLLYDTESLKSDILEDIRYRSLKMGLDTLDFSLATDGLLAEREQGITIDVAHIYFSTPKRNYIIADTPGHFEYTRNMVTGASTAQVAIILVDSRKGLQSQTFRHIFISALLRVDKVIVAINKMDLVAYSEERFYEIRSSLHPYFIRNEIAEEKIQYIPISALHGDNVAHQSKSMCWYSGPTLLECLESHESAKEVFTGLRFPVQMAIRPKTADFSEFRGYTGVVKNNVLSVGDLVTVLPSGQNSRVRSIHLFDKQFDRVPKGSAVTLTLEDDIDIDRGAMIVETECLPHRAQDIQATLCWMDTNPLQSGKTYLLQHQTNRVMAKIMALGQRLDTGFGDSDPLAEDFGLNDIGNVTIKLNKPIFYDRYEDNPQNGAFILIDGTSHATSAVGFIG